MVVSKTAHSVHSPTLIHTGSTFIFLIRQVDAFVFEEMWLHCAFCYLHVQEMFMKLLVFV